MDRPPKRQHYIPKSYLKNFLQNDFLCVYDRKKKSYHDQIPHDTAVKDNYYTTEIKGQKDYGVETTYGRYESRAKGVINKLRISEPITPKDHAALSIFLGFLACRTPKFEGDARELVDKGYKVFLKRYLFLNPEKIKLYLATPEGIVNSLSIKLPKAHISLLRLEKGIECGKCFNLMNWTVIHCKHPNSFITSDNPFGFMFFDDGRENQPYGLLSYDVLKIVPLSWDCCLFMHGYDCKFMHLYCADAKFIARTNAALAEASTRFIIGSNEDSVKAAVAQAKAEEENAGEAFDVKEYFNEESMENYIIAIKKCKPKK